MISALWLIPCAVIFATLGMLAMAMVAAGSHADERAKWDRERERLLNTIQAWYGSVVIPGVDLNKGASE